MIESFLGILIAAMAVSTLMLSITSMEKSYRNAGKQSLTEQEIEIINSAGLNNETNINLIKADIESLPQKF